MNRADAKTPAGTPRPVITRINAEFVKALKVPEVIAKWSKVIKAAGLKGSEGP